MRREIRRIEEERKNETVGSVNGRGGMEVRMRGIVFFQWK